jgi:hypothetical protein
VHQRALHHRVDLDITYSLEDPDSVPEPAVLIAEIHDEMRATSGSPVTSARANRGPRMRSARACGLAGGLPL